MPELPDLPDLVDAVMAEAGSDDPLERLAAAARTRDGLDDLTEALLDHFVEEARAAGCSWSQVGSALGVTKQAAQQRHTGDGSVIRRLISRVADLVHLPEGSMGTRFTPRARSAVEASEGEARRLQHAYIGTEHLLLGLLTQPEGIAARALVNLGAEVEVVRAEVESAVGRGGRASGWHLPFTPLAKRSLQLTLTEAVQLGHNYIGTEHVLLGLLTVGDGVAFDVLTRLGIDHDRARAEVVRLLLASLQGKTGT